MKKLIVFFLLASITAITLTSCSISTEPVKKDSEAETSSPVASQPDISSNLNSTSSCEAEFADDYLLFMDITINTKESDLQNIADKYGYHLYLTVYNTDNRSEDKLYEYELYDANQFKNDTEEKYRHNKSYYHIVVTYYHANDEANTQYIVSCKYNQTRGGKDLLIQNYDTATWTTEYSYWKKTTTAPSHQDENWHYAATAEEAIISYLSD